MWEESHFLLMLKMHLPIASDLEVASYMTIIMYDGGDWFSIRSRI